MLASEAASRAPIIVASSPPEPPPPSRPEAFVPPLSSHLMASHLILSRPPCMVVDVSNQTEVPSGNCICPSTAVTSLHVIAPCLRSAFPSRRPFSSHQPVRLVVLPQADRGVSSLAPSTLHQAVVLASPPPTLAHARRKRLRARLLQNRLVRADPVASPPPVPSFTFTPSGSPPYVQ